MQHKDGMIRLSVFDTSVGESFQPLGDIGKSYSECLNGTEWVLEV